jgi:hypothetical protein
MKTHNISLTSQQIVVLFEMCEIVGSLVHAKHQDDAKVLESFYLVKSIQDKLDGCEDLSNEAPSLLELAESEVGKEMVMPELLDCHLA